MQLFRVQATFPDGLKYPDFDVRVLKAGLRKEGREISNRARRLVSVRGVSRPGAMPGLQSGVLRKSIKAKVSRTGFTVKVKPYLTQWMKNGVFYPAFVYYGHRGPKTRTAWDNRRHGKTVGVKVAEPRAAFMIAAADQLGIPKINRDLATLMEAAVKTGVFKP